MAERRGHLTQAGGRTVSGRKNGAAFNGLPRFSEGELLLRRGTMRQFRAYLTQLTNNMAEMSPFSGAALLMFDADGCLLRLKGDPEITSWLEGKGILLGTRWQLNEIGLNAVTLGLEDQAAHTSLGEENQLPLLQDTALYYAPIKSSSGDQVLHWGGIALLTRLENHHPAYQMAVNSICTGLKIRLNMAWAISDAYEVDNRGIVLLDVNLKNRILYVTHHNRAFFSMLGIPEEPRQDSYFKDAAEYFDPLPLNKKFWTIVQGAQQVENQEISLSVRGRVVERIISTVPAGDPLLHSASIMVSITSRRQQARQVAEKTGNNAILSFDDIVGSSLIMQSKIRRAKLLANTDSNIMLLGESGVGKDVFAQAIHNQSSRRRGPFVAVNCGALPRDLIASELFGYDEGAFTGAKKQGNIGKFELANGGTLFLDEIGEMPLDLQATLLRAVEQKQFMRLGSSKTVRANVRIISATNVDITQMIQEKKFRADLYYRLCTMSLYLPPIRERGRDIVLLAEHFIERISARIGRTERMVLTESAKEFLMACEWYGNVREIQNLFECMVQLYPDREITVEMIRENVSAAYLPEGMPESLGPTAELPAAELQPSGWAQGQPQWTAQPQPVPMELSDRPAETVRDPFQPPRSERAKPSLTREDILQALEKAEGNRSKAAKLLGIGRRTFYRYIEQMNIGYKQTAP